jgi:hypothetical protein
MVYARHFPVRPVAQPSIPGKGLDAETIVALADDHVGDVMPLRDKVWDRASLCCP